MSMMKRKSIQQAINKGESLPVAVQKSKVGPNKHNLQYQVKLMNEDYLGRKKIKLIKSIYIGSDAYCLEETIARCDYRKWCV